MTCSGIGIVNAIEVVTAFPEEDGLQKFREWVESPDPTILGKTDAKTGSKVKKRGSASVDNKGIISGASTDDTEEIKQIFMDQHVWLFYHNLMLNLLWSNLFKIDKTFLLI